MRVRTPTFQRRSRPTALGRSALALLFAATSGCTEGTEGGDSERGDEIHATPTPTVNSPGLPGPDSDVPPSTASETTSPVGPPQPTATPSTGTTSPDSPTLSDPPSATVPAPPAPDAGAEPEPDPGHALVDDAGVDGECSPFVLPEDCSVPEGAVLPGELYCTGLYTDSQSRELRCDVVEYAPSYELWSDGAVKRRFVHIPHNAHVDVTDPDDFRYPVGTRFWKEFQVPDGNDLRLGETRLLERVELGWLYTSYVWSADGSKAVQENAGVIDLHGTGHTVPSREDCKTCHSGRRDFVLGWDALMLGPGATGITVETLEQADWVTWQGKSEGVPCPLHRSIPGDEVERAALGYLHSNCGVSCHNDNLSAEAYETGLFLRLNHDTLGSVQETPSFTSAWLRPHSPHATIDALPPLDDGRGYVALRPLDAEGSLILARMKVRGTEAAMPRLGTNRVDSAGVAAVQVWIEQMTPERGYPSADDDVQ